MRDQGMPVNTFSIVGYDPDGPYYGIAIASKFLGVGGQTCFGAPDAGVVVIQAHLNTHNGREGVDLLREGHSAEEVMARLIGKDPQPNLRQHAIVDARGGVATYTGEDCTPWAGGVKGDFCAAQGNMLIDGKGCDAMVEHFSTSTGFFPRRLVDALTTGDERGGDFRGRQSAALYVIRPPLGDPTDPYTDPLISLRVDDHENPFQELSRLLDLWELLYVPATEDEKLPPEGPAVTRYQRVLARLGYYEGEPSGALDEQTLSALSTLAVMQNYRRRLANPQAWLDGRLLEHLETKVGARL